MVSEAVQALVSEVRVFKLQVAYGAVWITSLIVYPGERDQSRLKHALFARLHVRIPTHPVPSCSIASGQSPLRGSGMRDGCLFGGTRKYSG